MMDGMKAAFWKGGFKFLPVLFMLAIAGRFALAQCSVVGDCTCAWTTTISAKNFMPNSTNQTQTCAVSCTDTDGSCLTMGSKCYIIIQKSQTGTGTTLVTGPTDGTSTDPMFCGGQSCTSTNVAAYSYTFTRNISAVRTNSTGTGLALRCYSALPGISASTWKKQTITSPGIPNLTGIQWYDGYQVAGRLSNGTNQSQRLEGNRTCFNASVISDGTVNNISLWGNMSVNGSNSTTFRLLETSSAAGLANSTATLCMNVTNGLNGVMGWANYSWALCVFNNWTTAGSAFSGSTSRNGFSCTNAGVRYDWVSGTSMSSANSVGTFNWFNVTWPNAAVAAPNPCIPASNTWWNVTTNLTCVYDDTNKSVIVGGLNVTERGSLKSVGMNLTDTGMFEITGSTDETQSVTIFRNGNLTIADNLTFDTVVIWSNLSVALNYSEGGTRRFNITKDGDLRIVNHTNATSLDGNPFWMDAEWGSNLTVWASDLDAYVVLESQGHNLTNSTLYYVRLHANNTHLSNLNVTRGFDLYAEDGASPVFNTTLTNISTRQCGIIGINITGTYLNCTNDEAITPGSALSVWGGDINLSWFVANSSEPTGGNDALYLDVENSSFEDFEAHSYDDTINIFAAAWTGMNLNFTRFNISNKPVLDTVAFCHTTIDPPGPPPPFTIQVRALISVAGGDALFRDGTFDGYCGMDDLENTGVLYMQNVSLLTTMLDTVAASPASYRVEWLINLFVNESVGGAAIPSADVRVFDGADSNDSTITDANGYAHLNLTQQFLGNKDTYTLLTLNASKVGYYNRTILYDFLFNGTDTVVGRAVTYPFLNLTVIPTNMSFVVNLSAPPNKSVQSGNVSLNWTVYRNVTSWVWCNVSVFVGPRSWLVVDSRNVSTNLTNTTFFGPLNASRYLWNVTCWDVAGNVGSSDTWIFRGSDWELAAAMLVLNGVCVLGWCVRPDGRG